MPGLLVDLVHGAVLQRADPAGTVDVTLLHVLAGLARYVQRVTRNVDGVLHVVVLHAGVVGGVQFDARLRRGGRRCGCRQRGCTRRHGCAGLCRRGRGLALARRHRLRGDVLFRNADRRVLVDVVAGERPRQVAIVHAAHLGQGVAGQRLRVGTDLVQHVAAHVDLFAVAVADHAEGAGGNRGLHRAIAGAALLVGQVQVQAGRRTASGQVRVAGALVAACHRVQVVLVHLCGRFGVAGRVELVAGQVVLARGAGHELEQALGAGRGIVGALVEGAAGLDVREAHEVIDRKAFLPGDLLDDVQDFLSAVVMLCHDVFLGVDGAAHAANRQPDSSVSQEHVGQQETRAWAGAIRARRTAGSRCRRCSARRRRRPAHGSCRGLRWWCP